MVGMGVGDKYSSNAVYGYFCRFEAVENGIAAASVNQQRVIAILKYETCVIAPCYGSMACAKKYYLFGFLHQRDL